MSRSKGFQVLASFDARLRLIEEESAKQTKLLEQIARAMGEGHAQVQSFYDDTLQAVDAAGSQARTAMRLVQSFEGRLAKLEHAGSNGSAD